MSNDQNEDVYIDLLATCSVQTNSNHRVPLVFNQTSSQPILKSTTGYKLSIIRFSLNTETLPIFIPTMRSANETIYSITMEYNGVQFQQFMQYEPQNLNPVDQDEYYYVYNYQYLIYLVNNCITSCLTGLGLANGATVAPTMTIDMTSKVVTINLDNNYFGYNESNKINIYMNYAMYTMFASLPATIVNKNKLGMDYQLNNLISQDLTSMTQDFATDMILNPVSSIVFTSNLIPIYQSSTPPIQIYVDGVVSNQNSSYNFLNILTDFIANDMQFVPYIQYSPSIYRFLGLKQNTEIRNIDLRVFWQNKNSGILKPLYIGCGGSCSIKLYFAQV